MNPSSRLITFLFSVFLFSASGLYVEGADGSTQKTNPTVVTIRGYYNEPQSIRNKNTIILEGVSDGEFVEIVIKGIVFEFQLVRLVWDDNKNDIVEKEIIYKIDVLKDKIVVIKTYMPEGIPFEKLKWKSATGKQYEFVIHEDCSDDFKGFWEFILD
mgnify:FL=1